MLFGLDPLFLDDAWVAQLLITVVKVVLAFALLLVSVMLMIWFERKLVSDMHNRIGPNVAGPWGILQTLADGVKLFFKEDLIPDKSDRFVFKLAPYLSLVPAFLVFAIVPIGGDFVNKDGVVTIFGHDTYLQVADPHIGVLFFLAMSSMAVYGIMLAGWSSGSKYPLLGSVRASAQMVSYEAALGLAVVAVLLQSESLSTHDIALGQAAGGPELFGAITLPNWNLLVTGFVPFVVFVIAGTAELNRPPFDLVEAEQELVGGFHTEYSSIRFALFFLAEFMNVITMSAIIVTLFLGGPAGPVPIESIGWAFGMLWFLVKLLPFLFFFVWLRATLPRLRYDQLMDLGWKLLIPVTLAWVLFLATRNVANEYDWSSGQIALAAAIGLGLLVLCTTLLMGAISAGERHHVEEELN